MLKGRLNYRCILSTEYDITKSLSYEEAIKEHAAKHPWKRVLQRCVGQLINKDNMFFWIL